MPEDLRIRSRIHPPAGFGCRGYQKNGHLWPFCHENVLNTRIKKMATCGDIQNLNLSWEIYVTDFRNENEVTFCVNLVIKNARSPPSPVADVLGFRLRKAWSSGEGSRFWVAIFHRSPTESDGVARTPVMLFRDGKMRISASRSRFSVTESRFPVTLFRNGEMRISHFPVSQKRNRKGVTFA